MNKNLLEKPVSFSWNINPKPKEICISSSEYLKLKRSEKAFNALKEFLTNNKYDVLMTDEWLTISKKEKENNDNK